MTRADWIDLLVRAFFVASFLTLSIALSLGALVSYTTGLGR